MRRGVIAAPFCFLAVSQQDSARMMFAGQATSANAYWKIGVFRVVENSCDGC